MNIKLVTSAAVAVLVFTTPATSAASLDGLSANIGVTSDYLWRGISQTDGSPAVSGGLDYKVGNGLYLGTWASNVDFGDDTTYELDGYLGFSGELSAVSYDFGYIYYAYPNGEDLDFGEVYASLGLSYFKLGLAVLAHADSADFADNNYYYAEAAFPVADDLKIGAHLGTYTFDASEDYIDYNIYVDYKGLNFKLSDTDLDNDDMKAVVSYAWRF